MTQRRELLAPEVLRLSHSAGDNTVSDRHRPRRVIPDSARPIRRRRQVVRDRAVNDLGGSRIEDAATNAVVRARAYGEILADGAVDEI